MTEIPEKRREAYNIIALWSVKSGTHTTVRDKVDSWSMNSSQSGNEYSISYNE